MNQKTNKEIEQLMKVSFAEGLLLMLSFLIFATIIETFIRFDWVSIVILNFVLLFLIWVIISLGKDLLEYKKLYIIRADLYNVIDKIKEDQKKELKEKKKENESR